MIFSCFRISLYIFGKPGNGMACHSETVSSSSDLLPTVYFRRFTLLFNRTNPSAYERQSEKISGGTETALKNRLRR